MAYTNFRGSSSTKTFRKNVFVIDGRWIFLSITIRLIKKIVNFEVYVLIKLVAKWETLKWDVQIGLFYITFRQSCCIYLCVVVLMTMCTQNMIIGWVVKAWKIVGNTYRTLGYYPSTTILPSLEDRSLLTPPGRGPGVNVKIDRCWINKLTVYVPVIFLPTYSLYIKGCIFFSTVIHIKSAQCFVFHVHNISIDFNIKEYF